MIDITTSEGVNQMFIEITSLEPSAQRSTMIRNFAKTFWAQLSKEHRAAYKQCYCQPKKFDYDLAMKNYYLEGKQLLKQDFDAFATL